MDVCLSDAFA
ncbi:hypothetical protein COR21_18395 [Vibrio cholerae]|nr:hypothetical protein [Vibrio cholerae]